MNRRVCVICQRELRTHEAMLGRTCDYGPCRLAYQQHLRDGSPLCESCFAPLAREIQLQGRTTCSSISCRGLPPRAMDVDAHCEICRCRYSGSGSVCSDRDCRVIYSERHYVPPIDDIEATADSRFQHFYQQIPGWFSFRSLYRHVVKRYPSGSHFVEIGAWQGKSAAFMAVEIANSEKDIQFDVIDHWNGSHEHQDPDSYFHEPRLKDPDWLYNAFLQNTKSVEGLIQPRRMESVEAARKYDARSLDFVFVDGAHDHESVAADIQAWSPKVKPGGLLAGDDFEQQSVRDAVFDTLQRKAIIPWDSAWVVEM